MYALSLHGEAIYKYKLLWLFGFNLPRPMVARGGLFWLQTPENQEGSSWPLWYMERSNHMAHGPCIHEYF